MDNGTKQRMNREEAKQGNFLEINSVELLDLALNDFDEFKRQVLRNGKNDRAPGRDDRSRL